MSVVIRNARASDFKELPPGRVKAVTIEKDGRAVVVGGLLIHPLQTMAFMNVEELLPISIMKATKRVVKALFSGYPRPIYAESRTVSAGRFLAHVGFIPICENIYVWGGE